MVSTDTISPPVAAATRFLEDVLNGDDLDAFDDLTTDDLAVHRLGGDVDEDGPTFRAFNERFHEAVPDLRHEIEDTVAGEGLVTFRCRTRGTPERPMAAIVPTGKSFEIASFHQFRIEDGRVAEYWVLPNVAATLAQLGLLPNTPGNLLRMLGRQVTGRLRARKA